MCSNGCDGGCKGYSATGRVVGIVGVPATANLDAGADLAQLVSTAPNFWILDFVCPKKDFADVLRSIWPERSVWLLCARLQIRLQRFAITTVFGAVVGL